MIPMLIPLPALCDENSSDSSDTDQSSSPSYNDSMEPPCKRRMGNVEPARKIRAKMQAESTTSSLELPPAPDMRTPQLFSCPAASSTDVEQNGLAEHIISQHLHVWQHALGSASTPPLTAPLASNSGPDTSSAGPELQQGVSPAFMDVLTMHEIYAAEEAGSVEQWIIKQNENLDHLMAQPPETWGSFLNQKRIESTDFKPYQDLAGKSSPAFMGVHEIHTAEEAGSVEQWINKQTENLDHLKAQPPETWKSFLKQKRNESMDFKPYQDLAGESKKSASSECKWVVQPTYKWN